MRFKGVVKDAKLSGRGINIHILGGDDCSTDELRVYFDEAVMVGIEIIAPDNAVEVDADGWQLNGEE